MTRSAAWAMLIGTALLSGCADKTVDIRRELISTRDDLGQSQRRIVELQSQLEQCQNQVQTLTNLGDERLQDVYLVQRVEIGRRSSGVSTDDQEGDDALRVYVEPIDQFGHVIKAAGAITVRLFDLAAPPDTLIGECVLTPKEAGSLWTGSFTGSYFMLTCPWNRPPTVDEITVRVEFTDYATGKTFTAQRVVKAQPSRAR